MLTKLSVLRLYHRLEFSFYKRLHTLLTPWRFNRFIFRIWWWCLGKGLEVNEKQHECHYLWMRSKGYNDTQINFIWERDGYMEARRETQEAIRQLEEWTRRNNNGT